METLERSKSNTCMMYYCRCILDAVAPGVWKARDRETLEKKVRTGPANPRRTRILGDYFFDFSQIRMQYVRIGK